MSVLCISRQFGAGSKTLAEAAARRLGYRFADEELVSRVAKEANVVDEWIEVTEREAKRTGKSETDQRHDRELTDQPDQNSRRHFENSRKVGHAQRGPHRKHDDLQHRDEHDAHLATAKTNDPGRKRNERLVIGHADNDAGGNPDREGKLPEHAVASRCRHGKTQDSTGKRRPDPVCFSGDADEKKDNHKHAGQTEKNA